MPNTSVIVPAYNAASTLGACLESLLAQTRRPFEIIVVDDASTDDTSAIALRHGTRLVRLPSNSGPGVARNAGAGEARGDILAFTDADCVAPPDWLAAMLAVLDAPGVVAATGGYAGPVRQSYLRWLQHLLIRRRQSGLPAEIESTITSNLVCRAQVFHAVRGFPLYYRKNDPGKPIWGNEDEELGFLLARHGKVRWVSGGGVLHDFRPGLTGFLRQQRFYAERIVMSHFRFPEMASGATNYSRLSGIVHLFSTLGVCAGFVALAAALAGCDAIHWPAINLKDLAVGDAIELLCSAGAGLLLVLLPIWLLLPLRTLRDLRRAGESFGFLLKTYPVLLAMDFAWLHGAVRGTLLSIGGFLDGTRESPAASASTDR